MIFLLYELMPYYVLHKISVGKTVRSIWGGELESDIKKEGQFKNGRERATKS